MRGNMWILTLCSLAAMLGLYNSKSTTPFSARTSRTRSVQTDCGRPVILNDMVGVEIIMPSRDLRRR
jgi:hypothetical protein